VPLAVVDEDGNTALWVAGDGVVVGQLIEDTDFVQAASDASGSMVLYEDQFLDLPGAWGDAASPLEVGTAATERYVYAGLMSLPNAPFQMSRQRLHDPHLGPPFLWS
jgi:hypothetical protein